MVPLSDLAEIAKTHGAPVCGAAKTEDLSGNAGEIGKILHGARSVVVLAAPHSRSAIESADVRMAQYDTVYAYGEAARASHAAAPWLEQRGPRAGGLAGEAVVVDSRNRPRLPRERGRCDRPGGGHRRFQLRRRPPSRIPEGGGGGEKPPFDRPERRPRQRAAHRRARGRPAPDERV